ncbi:MAG: DoxX family protein [Xanthobacteraceae bacterium]|nr:DoxX family protein [Xanthobacteraceae bacterium]
MPEPSVPLILPALGAVYAAASPWAEAALRAAVGLLLVPHGLRLTFGLFPGSGPPVRNLAMLAEHLERGGYRPGRIWAPLISATELIAGPLLALGLFTRLAALPVAIFLIVSCVERWRVGGWFWNTQGVEYTLLWALAALYFLVHGGGALSLDHVLLKREF